MGATHAYQIHIRWTGNRGTGTSGYRTYDRDHLIEADGKPALEASADPALALHGDAHGLCFIANSVTFPVRCEPTIIGPPEERTAPIPDRPEPIE